MMLPVFHIRVRRRWPGEHMLPRRRGARKRCYGETSWATFSSTAMTQSGLGGNAVLQATQFELVINLDELGIEKPPELCTYCGRGRLLAGQGPAKLWPDAKM